MRISGSEQTSCRYSLISIHTLRALSNYTTQIAGLSELERRASERNLVEGTLLVCLRRIEAVSFQCKARCSVPRLTRRTLSGDGLWTHWRSRPMGRNKPCPSPELEEHYKPCGRIFMKIDLGQETQCCLGIICIYEFTFVLCKIALIHYYPL